jgi:hypothetical protein
LWYHETKWTATVPRKFRNEYGQPLPDVDSIKAWYSKFVETGSVGDLTRSGRPSVSDEPTIFVSDEPTIFVSDEPTISANVHPDILELYVAPQIEDFQP